MLRAVTVAVGYDDLLRVTLPYNRHHFSEVHVVTDRKSICGVVDAISMLPVPQQAGIVTWVTDLFYADGAKFNKWRALEWALDQLGREGWLSIMDADVLWPRDVRVAEFGESLRFGLTDGRGDLLVHRGHLMSPLRRMAPWPHPAFLAEYRADGQTTGAQIVTCPPESEWAKYSVHPNRAEHAGYTQVFHASDPVLPAPPWHQVDWEHAGGADSFFQQLWPAAAKVRPPWEVLHLGEAGKNWYGRATKLADGTVPEGSQSRLQKCAEIWRERRRREALGLPRFGAERITLPGADGGR